MDLKTRLRAYAALLSAMLVWGFSFLAIKDAIGVVPVFSLLFLRFLLATVLLGGFVWAKRSFRLPARDLWLLAGLSALSPVGYFLFETYGVAHTQPSHVAVLIATIPVVVYLIALARRKEHATWRKTVGILIACAGIFLMVGLGRSEEGASLSGDLLVLGAVLFASVRTSLIKDALTRVSPLQLTFYQFLFSLAVFGPLAATDGLGWVSSLGPMPILEILFLGVVCSAGAFLALHYALSHLAATQVAVTTNLVPVITLLAEVTILGSLMTLPKLAGTLLVVVGVVLTQLTAPVRRADLIAEG